MIKFLLLVISINILKILDFSFIKFLNQSLFKKNIYDLQDKMHKVPLAGCNVRC